MSEFPKDIYTEPTDVDVDTLSNLGPLSGMAGIWQGDDGSDIHPVATGKKGQIYVERYELQPVDPTTNGPQLLYGLRYHTHITKPGKAKTFHEQVGYWLWEPATETVIHTVAIPRGQTALAIGKASKDAKSFELESKHGSVINGISSIPFLEHAFKTVEFRIKVTINPEGTWEYDEDTVMMIAGQSEPFHHTDSHLLKKVAEPTPNPLFRERALA